MKSVLLALMMCVMFLGACAQDKPSELLTPVQYKSLAQKEKGVLLDVRTPEEFAAGHLHTALNSDFSGGKFGKEFTAWDKDKTYYVYCASGNRSGKAVQQMKAAGFTKVYNIGGFTSLKEAGVPVGDQK
ncbi:rhodanese-like domain-containing protein [Rufibacter sp. DG15C]|uniref:rhodanese-like domain-containing protein n=1 Tax=Rufibacter sp. DG15C TaxID=1379909 RepID=UPI0008300F8C|nr:rhodanese-like domain-containing protein [Rufibacter sp. DG15C]